MNGGSPSAPASPGFQGDSRGRTRTGTPLRAADFESAASAIPPLGRLARRGTRERERNHAGPGSSSWRDRSGAPATVGSRLRIGRVGDEGIVGIGVAVREIVVLQDVLLEVIALEVAAQAAVGRADAGGDVVLARDLGEADHEVGDEADHPLPIESGILTRRSPLVTLLCVLVNYLVPQNALEILMSLVVATLVINWAMISLAHLKFRRAMKAQGVQTHFPAIWAPFSNYLCLAFVLFILGVLLLIPGIRISVFVIPFWLLLMWFAYLLRLRMGRAPASY